MGTVILAQIVIHTLYSDYDAASACQKCCRTLMENFLVSSLCAMVIKGQTLNGYEDFFHKSSAENKEVEASFQLSVKQ